MDNEKAARLGKGLFFIGSAACLVSMFAYLTPHTLAYITQSNHMENGKGVPADVVRGKQVFHKFGCMDCHTILGDGTQYAPELGRLAISRPDAYLKAYVKNARGLNPQSGMPNFPAMSDAEATDLVTFLNFTSKVNLPEDLWAEMKAKNDPYDARAYDPKHNPFYRSYWPPRPMSADKKDKVSSNPGQTPSSLLGLTF
ncbi:Nitric oxide reductase subunit C [compost metagenome]